MRIAPVPAHILPRSNAAPGLLAHIVTAKYSLPLHRQETIFARHGVAPPRATQAAWIIGVAPQLQPLMDERLRTCGYIRIDETPVQVLDGEKAANSEHWMWVRVVGPPGQRLILFDYDASRGSYVAERLLDGASGYMQSDGYAAHDAVAAQLSLTHVGCFAHARRRFFEAVQALLGGFFGRD
jgi:transposase